MSAASPAEHSPRFPYQHIPRIGVTADITPNWRASDGAVFYGQTEHYAKAIYRAGGAATYLTYPEDFDHPEAEAQLYATYADLDGLILSGGLDVSPEHGGAPAIQDDYPYMPHRDYAEKKLIEWAESDRKPCLFICRGMQIWNIYNSGSLYSDIPTDVANSLKHRSPAGPDHQHHPISIVTNSLLHELIEITNNGSHTVNSHHHQAIDEKRLGKHLKVTATAPDGIIEAVETTKPGWFALGTQWHEEAMHHSQGIFDALIAAARSRHMAATPPLLKIAS